MAEPLQGTGSQTSQGEGEPQYATPSQVAQMVNQAISARGKAQEEKFLKTLDEKLREFSGGFNARVEELFSEGGGKKGKKNSEGETDPAMRGFQKQLEDMKAAHAQTQQELQAERNKIKDRDLRSAVSEVLSGAGVEGTRGKHALAWLVDSAKAVRYDEDGEGIVFTDPTGAALDLKTGIQGWLKTEDGKEYLPASGPIGSGSRPGGGLKRADGKTDTQNLARSLGALLVGQINT